MVANLGTITPADIAAWPTPDYEHAHGQSRYWLTGFSAAWLSVTTILAFARLGLRSKHKGGSLGLDDLFLGISWMLLVGFEACIIFSVNKQTVTRHIWDVPPHKLPTFALVAWVCQLLFLFGTGTAKISVLFFNRRLVRDTFRPLWTWATWAGIGFTAFYNIVFGLMLVFNCSPVQAYWKNIDLVWAGTHQWQCWDSKVNNYFVGILAVLTDVYTIFLPWAMTWSLELPRKQRLGLNAIFSAGLVVIVAAGFRTDLLVRLGYSTDPTWVAFGLYLWALLEWNLGIICACIPSLRVLFYTALKSTPNDSKKIKHSDTPNNTGGWSGQHSNNAGDWSPSKAIELESTFTIESSTVFPLDNKKPLTRYSDAAKTTSYTRCDGTFTPDRPGTQHQTLGSTSWLQESDELKLLARSEHGSSFGGSSVRPASPVCD